MKKGRFIVIYGLNNLGKTVQAELLVDYFKKKGEKAEYLKYAVYDLEPTGPIIDKILRSGKQEISEDEFQLWQVLNRYQYQPILLKKLSRGINMITECYIGTALAWGSIKGADLKWMEDINKYLKKPDLAILLDGERFTEAKEKNHIHEQNEKWAAAVRKMYLELASKYGWIIVQANQSKEQVHKDMVKIVEEFLNNSS